MFSKSSTHLYMLGRW